MVDLIHDNVFNVGYHELILIPSSRNGNFEISTHVDLIEKEFPRKISFYQKEVIKFQKVQNNYVKYIGFASLVNKLSGEAYIERFTYIIEQLKKFSDDNNLSEINIPFLELTHRGVRNIDLFNCLSNEFRESKATCKIYCASNTIYKEITMQKPLVFICYAHDDAKNVEWVNKFVLLLRKNYIDARYDEYFNMDNTIQDQMDENLHSADKVILICDECFLNKARKPEGGVGWEIRQIKLDMKRTGYRRNKYIPINRTDEKIEGTFPDFLQYYYILDWGPDEQISPLQFDRLMKYLKGINLEPPLGA